MVIPLFFLPYLVHIFLGNETGVFHRSSEASEFLRKNSSGRDGHSVSDTNEEEKCDILVQKQVQSWHQ